MYSVGIEDMNLVHIFHTRLKVKIDNKSNVSTCRKLGANLFHMRYCRVNVFYLGDKIATGLLILIVDNILIILINNGHMEKP